MGSRVSYATVRYGGFGGDAWEGSTRYGNINVYYALVNIENCTISDSAHNGIELAEYSAQIINCTFTNNGSAANDHDIHGAVTVYSDARMEGCHFLSGAALCCLVGRGCHRRLMAEYLCPWQRHPRARVGWCRKMRPGAIMACPITSAAISSSPTPTSPVLTLSPPS